MAIKKVSQETRDAIKRKSAFALPNRPSEAGIKPEELKRAFFAPVTDAALSALGEVDRVVGETNTEFEYTNERIEIHKGQLDNPHNVTAEQVGLGLVDNTSDMDKPVSQQQYMAIEERVLRVATEQEEVYVTDDAEGSVRPPVVLSEAAVGGTIPKRDAAGNVSVGSATDFRHAISKALLEAAVEKLVAKAGNQVIDGDLSISGDLYVTGSTYGTDVESLNVKDAVIVANADGIPLAELSGYVIRVSDTQAYGILYDPVEDCVKIGLGTFDGKSKVFAYDAGEAQILATRGAIPHGNVPVWDGEAHTFGDSGIPAGSIADKAYVEGYLEDIYGRGYDDGYAEGKAESEKSFANALKGTEEGANAVRMDDVSPLEHTLEVKVSGMDDASAVRVKRYGKNLLNDSVEQVGRVSYISSASEEKSYYGFSFKLSEGVYTAHAEGDIENDFIYGWLCDAEKNTKTRVHIVVGTALETVTFTAAEGDLLVLFNAGMAGTETIDMAKALFSRYNIQVEVGEKATAYEAYVAPVEYTPNADGTVEGVLSLSSTTTLVSDTAGVTVTATYNRDINTAYAELVNAIISLGGNV